MAKMLQAILEYLPRQGIQIPDNLFCYAWTLDRGMINCILFKLARSNHELGIFSLRQSCGSWSVFKTHSLSMLTRVWLSKEKYKNYLPLAKTVWATWWIFMDTLDMLDLSNSLVNLQCIGRPNLIKWTNIWSKIDYWVSNKLPPPSALRGTNV